MNSRMLVTGANGCLGSHLVDRLQSAGCETQVFVRPQADLTDLNTQDVGIFRGDLNDRAALAPALQNVDTVFHCAARMHDWGEWELYKRANVDGTQSLLEACVAAGVRKFVHISSTGISGLHEQRGAVEKVPYAPKGYYEESKVAQEKLVLDYVRQGRIEGVIVRPCWILGPRARRHLPILIEHVLTKWVFVLGNGRNVLSFVDPRDAADGVLLASQKGGSTGEIFNITNDRHSDTQADLTGMLAKELDAKVHYVRLPYWAAWCLGWLMEKLALLIRTGDAPILTPIRVEFVGLHRDFSCEKAKSMLGYQPRYRLEQSLADGVRWYREKVQRAA